MALKKGAKLAKRSLKAQNAPTACVVPQSRILTLAELPTGRRCVIDRLDLPEEMARRLMELGFLPGNEVIPARRAPGGGPRVFRVDGSEVALRNETAARMFVRPHPEGELVVLS